MSHTPHRRFIVASNCRHTASALGGDQQFGAMIAERTLDLLVFFWDPLSPQPHDPDVKALLRIAVVWNLPIACNRATADFLISSPLLAGAYERSIPSYDEPSAERRAPSAERMRSA